jgi:hypothetical protein
MDKLQKGEAPSLTANQPSHGGKSSTDRPKGSLVFFVTAVYNDANIFMTELIVNERRCTSKLSSKKFSGSKKSSNSLQRNGMPTQTKTGG